MFYNADTAITACEQPAAFGGLTLRSSMNQELFILAMGVHPDDVELSCAGTLVTHMHMGHRVGVLDLTEGELGTRGTPKIRLAEAAASAKVLGLAVRENLGYRDGFFLNDEAHQLGIIRFLRKWRPKIVLANAIDDRHPDHGRAAKLIADACFLSGLARIETLDDAGRQQEAWRPKRLFHYIQDRQLVPDFAVDISDAFEKKLESIRAFKSQFHDPNSNEPETYISSQNFLEQIRHRDAMMGKRIGVQFAEGFTSANTPGLHSLSDLLLPEVA